MTDDLADIANGPNRLAPPCSAHRGIRRGNVADYRPPSDPERRVHPIPTTVAAEDGARTRIAHSEQTKSSVRKIQDAIFGGKKS
jgi:hypothetical protein